MPGHNTTLHAKRLLNHQFGGPTWTAPASYQVALLAAEIWQPGKSYPVGAVVVPTDFPAGVTWTLSRVFKCVATGLSGPSEPNWATVPGGFVTDNTCQWQEQAAVLEGGDISFMEVSTARWTNYARVTIANNVTNFPPATGSVEATKTLATAVDFGTVALSGPPYSIVGMAICDGSEALYWGTLPAVLIVANGTPVSFPVGSIVFGLQ